MNERVNLDKYNGKLVQVDYGKGGMTLASVVIAVDEYFKSKPIHMAKMISSTGHISPLCAEIPRIIDIENEIWTNRKEAVTCEKCKVILILNE